MLFGGAARPTFLGCVSRYFTPLLLGQLLGASLAALEAPKPPQCHGVWVLPLIRGFVLDFARGDIDNQLGALARVAWPFLS